jgi:hypothetical protein
MWKCSDEVITQKGTQHLLDGEEVTNVIGSKDDNGRWKAFWKKHAHKTWPETCQIYGCSDDATDGAHIYVKGWTSNKFYYILPTCHPCNVDATKKYGMKDGWMNVKKGAVCISTPIPEKVLDEGKRKK